MKIGILVLALVVSVFAAGCATSNYTYGRDFPSENAKQIVKGKTTSAELVRIVGEPFSKHVISETEEKWIYTYANGSSSAQSYIVTMKVKTTGQQKTLDVLLKNGVVVNYVLNEGPMATSNVN